MRVERRWGSLLYQHFISLPFLLKHLHWRVVIWPALAHELLHMHLPLPVLSRFPCILVLCSLWFLNMWVGVLLSILVNLLAVTFPNIASVPCCISSFFWYSSYIKPLGIPVLCPICFVVVFSMCFSFFYWPTLEFHKHVFCLIQADVKTHLKS